MSFNNNNSLTPPNITFLTGALIGAGGVMGYARARSVPSLVAGLTVGGLFFLGGHLANSGKATTGHGIALVGSLVLSAASINRVRAAPGAPVPTALLAVGVLSTLYQGYLLSNLLKN